jgi:Cellulase (glycosyl hydrolase family 5)
MRLTRLVLVCALLTLIAPVSALAADRMWIGFQDDPTFRWREDRANMLDEAVDANAGIIRTTVYWSRIAPRRPSNPSNPFDPAYNFDDLDEFVRGAQFRGLETLLTIWGTPNWANGSKGQNFAPTRMADITGFARALASRYSGRYPGYPYVRFFSVWNEPNLQQFLAPTFDKKGKPVSPFTYANLYRAAYSGLKAGSPGAQVGVGETSPRGRDKPSPGPIQDSIAPATFARLLSTSKPKVKFDGYAHHPYSVLGAGPLQKARYPNVHLTQLPQFSKDLHKWFGRSISLWITEYGFETKPAEPHGVTLSQQAAYTRQTLNLLKRIPNVKMLVWFIFRDDPTSTWQSGLISRPGPGGNGTRKPAFAAFASTAKLLDARSPIVRARLNRAPIVRVSALELAARNGSGTLIGANIKVYGQGSQFYGNIQMQSTIARDGWASFTFAPNGTRRVYYLFFELQDKNGNSVQRSATLIIQ